MIAVPVWSNLMFVIVLIGFGALLFALLLAIVPPLRRRIWRHRGMRIGVLIASPILAPGAAIAIYVLYVFWQVDRIQSAPESARHVTLAKATRFGVLTFPAGTRLDLYDAYVMRESNIRKATFPQPVAIQGFDAMTLQPDLYGFTITGVGSRIVEGWRCDLTQPISFRTRDDDDKPIPMRLTACRLAPGNRVGDIALPGGLSLTESLGERNYPEILALALAQDIVFGDWRVPLSHACLYVDRTHHALVRIYGAALARPFRAGGVTWPPGTRVSWDPDSVAQPAQWRDNRRILDIGPWEFQPAIPGVSDGAC